MKIGAKLGVAFALITAILIIVIYMGINASSNLNNSVQELAKDKFPKTVWANGIIDAVNEGARALRNAILTDDPKDRDTQIERTKATTPKVAMYLDSLTNTVKSEQGIKILNEMKEARNIFVKERETLIKLIMENKKKEATDLLFTSFRKVQTAYLEKINEMIKYQSELFDKSALEAEETYNAQFNLLIILGLVAVLLAIILAVIVTRGITKPLSTGVNIAEEIARGNTNVNIEVKGKDETAMLLTAMKGMAGTIKEIINEINNSVKMAKDGKLDYRANSAKYQGDFKELVLGFNSTLDAVIGPLNVAAEYVDRISKGDIPPKITDEYKGDFNEIKNNLNTCIDAVNLLVSDANMLVRAAVDGRLDTRADASRHQGDFRKIVQGVNDTLDAVIGPLNVAAEYVDRISKGDIPPKITDEYKGDFNEIKNNLNTCIDAVNLLVSDANMLARAAVEGRLDTRADASRHQGDFRKIVQGVNDTLDAVIGPLNVAAEYIDRISKGDIPPKITDEYKGDFNEIKNNLNTCIDAVNLLVSDANMLARAAVEGRLDTRADASRHQGDFRKIVQGVNDTLDAVIGPLNVAAEYVDRISKGDIPPKITDEYKGDFNEIKNNLNTCIDAVNLLVSDANMLARAAVEGRLDTRADASRHQGDFRKIVQGVNDTLNAVIGPLNVAAEYIDRISKGDIPPKITDEYKGDFNEIKNNLNLLIDADQRISNILLEVSKGNLNVTINERSSQDILIKSLKTTIKSIQELIDDTEIIANAAEEGKLEVRADIDKHEGAYKELIKSFNNTLNSVITPIKEAGQVLGIMAMGDLTVRMLGDYKGDLSKLKDDINSLADSLNGLIQQVNELVNNTASSAAEISATAESIATASQEQSSQADEVASAVEEMTRTITENALAANKTAEVAKVSGKIATEGGSVVSQTVNKMRDIANVVKNSADNIQKLGESSKQIGEIISVIDDIADQTNLLALNAAIEAARAGEQGRGFAVVADEVRKLAERTTEATKQIAVMIKGIQSETEAAVLAMNKGTIEVTSGIELADKAGQSLQQILNSTQEVIDMINQIAAASEEQSATSEQISKNVTSISQVTAESAKRVEDVAHTAEDLAKMTNQLADLMRQFKIDEYSSNMPMRQLSRNRAKQLGSKLG